MQFTPYALINFIVTLVALWLGYLIWSRRPGIGVRAHVLLSFGLMLWAFGSGIELLVIDLNAKLLTTHMTYAGITLSTSAWFVFVLQYTGYGKYVTRRLILFLLIEPILVQVLILTNPLHALFWESIALEAVDGLTVARYGYGSAFWIHAVYAYGLLLISLILLVRSLIRSSPLYRGQVTYLLLSSLTPWIANFLYVSRLSPLPDFVDLTPPSFLIVVATAAWNLYRYRLMDIIPVARDTIVEGMTDSIIVIDRSDRIVDINPAALRLLNVPAGTALGRPAAEIITGQEHVVEQFRNVDEVDSEIETEIGGKRRNFNLRIIPLRNRQQELTARIVVLHDITGLKQTNEQLKIASERAEESTRLKSQFLATMSHELRTPLNAIIGYTELSLMGMVGNLNDTQKQYQERVLANSKHLLGLINDILDLSRIEAGRFELLIQPFNVADWVRDIVEQHAVLASEKGIGFASELDPSLPEQVLGDARHLRQIVVNLISNGIKFTKEGTVSVTVRREPPHEDGEYWSIQVRDTGIGIPASQRETIFTEFYQVDSSLTREFGGTGLGLTIVHRLIMTMGGTIRVESTEGAGSTFTVTLPLVPVKDQAPAPVSAHLT